MKEALDEEIRLSKEAGEGTHVTKEYGELPALTMSTDGCWQRRASGRHYDSASGCVHFIGVRCKKVCARRLNINRCYICARIERLEGKKQKAKRVKKKESAKKYKSKIKEIKTHRCLKNFWGTSKAMEADSIVRLVKKFPKHKGAYIRGLCMDDDATTPAHLKEDTGPKCSGQLSKGLTGITIFADTLHSK